MSNAFCSCMCGVDCVGFCTTICVCLVFDSAADICDLKIIKDVAEARSLVTPSGQQRSRKANVGQTVVNHRQGNRLVSPKAQDKSIVTFQHSLPHTAPTHSTNTENSKRPNGAVGLKSTSSASPRKTVKTSSRGVNNKKSQTVAAVDSRSSPYKTQINGYRQVNGMARMKGFDAGRIGGYSPSDLSDHVQSLTVSDETINTADCFSENDHRNVSRKRLNSGIISVTFVPLQSSRKRVIHCTISVII